MAEDSGAFKTNPRDSARFRHFVMTRQRVASKPHWIKKTFPGLPRAFTPSICNKRHRYLAVFSNQPDSLRAGGSRCVANPADFVVIAFPIAQGPSQTPLRRRNSPFHAAKFPFSVRRDRVVDVDTGLRAWRGGAAAHRSRGICQ